MLVQFEKRTTGPIWKIKIEPTRNKTVTILMLINVSLLEFIPCWLTGRNFCGWLLVVEWTFFRWLGFGSWVVELTTKVKYQLHRQLPTTIY